MVPKQRKLSLWWQAENGLAHKAAGLPQSRKTGRAQTTEQRGDLHRRPRDLQLHTSVSPPARATRTRHPHARDAHGPRPKDPPASRVATCVCGWGAQPLIHYFWRHRMSRTECCTSPKRNGRFSPRSPPAARHHCHARSEVLYPGSTSSGVAKKMNQGCAPHPHNRTPRREGGTSFGGRGGARVSEVE